MPGEIDPEENSGIHRRVAYLNIAGTFLICFGGIEPNDVSGAIGFHTVPLRLEIVSDFAVGAVLLSPYFQKLSPRLRAFGRLLPRPIPAWAVITDRAKADASIRSFFILPLASESLNDC